MAGQCRVRVLSASDKIAYRTSFAPETMGIKCVQTALMLHKHAAKLRISYKEPPLIAVWLDVGVQSARGPKFGLHFD
jgi:hypothetical protein